MLKRGRRRQKEPPFCNNPWNLSVREAQVMILIADMDRNDIAKEMGITPRGVDAHTHNCRKKIGVDNRASLAVQFDRWWQVWQREHRDKLPAALKLFEEVGE